MVRKTGVSVLVGLCLLLAQGLSATEQPALQAELEVFRPYLDKTWQGTLSQPGQPPMTDISHWERALNGTAIKVRHSVNQGDYGGETFIFYDKATQALTYYYFTTAGFYTHGTMQFDDKSGQLIAEEEVKNNKNGITRVRSKSLLQANKLQTSSEYLQNGKWLPGHSAEYKLAPAAQVVFK